jgi:leucyl-tRNA synthetase
LGKEGALLRAPWPIWDESVATEEEMTIVIQVNGKVRGKILIAVDEAPEKIQALALAEEKVAKFIEGKKIIKQVYVPGRLVNIVIQG